MWLACRHEAPNSARFAPSRRVVEMDTNQRPRSAAPSVGYEASPPTGQGHGGTRRRSHTPTRPSSSSSPSVGLKKAPTGRAPSPSLSPRSIKPPQSRRPPSVASSSAGGGNRKAPKPWWEYEEALARLAFELRGEAAAQRAAHTNDLGILLQQQLALRARIDELQNAVDSGDGGRTLALSGSAAAGGRGRLAAAVAETASDAQALQLSLLERGAASLRLEADGARESAEAAEREALAASAELARLHSQLAQLTKRLHAAEAAAARGGNSSSSPHAVSRAEELGAALGAVEASGAGGAALSVDKGAASRGAREERLQMQLASVT